MDPLGIAAEKIEMLKQFVKLCKMNPSLLNVPQMKFFKDWIVNDLGGTIPGSASSSEHTNGDNVDSEKPKPSYANAAKDNKSAWGEHMAESSDDSDESESDDSDEIMMEDFGDDENVIAGDNDPPQDMGDDAKEPTDQEQDEAMSMRSLGMQAMGDGDNEGAIKHFTAGILLDNSKTVLFVKRGTAYLRLKKPNAAIRDCRKALLLNPDSAAAYKTLGKAQKLLGLWDEACHSFEEAQKIDFDEDILDLLKDIKPKATKIREYKLAVERKQKEKEIKERIKRVKKAKKKQEKARKAQEKREQEEAASGSGGMPDMSGMFGPGGTFQFPGGGDFSQADFAKFAQQFQQQQQQQKKKEGEPNSPPPFSTHVPGEDDLD